MVDDKQLKQGGTEIFPIVQCVNDLTTGGANKPASAETVKALEANKLNAESRISDSEIDSLW